MRIASLISAGTEMLFALGLGDQVVTVSHECDWPESVNRLPRVTRSNVNATADSGAIDRQVRELLKAGRPLYEIDIRQLAQLRPDLIVTQAQCDVCAVRYDDVLAAVHATPQLSQTQVFSLNPQSLADVFRDVKRLGEAGGIPVRAGQVAAELQRRVESVQASSAVIPAADRPRVAMIEWTDPLMLAGNWVPELIELAGGRCERTPPGRHSRALTWEELVRFDPQVIVVCPCGFDRRRAAAEIEQLSGRSEWQGLSAVRSGRVHAVDGNAYFNRPGPRLVESLELLAGLIRSRYSTPSPQPSPRGRGSGHSSHSPLI